MSDEQREPEPTTPDGPPADRPAGALSRRALLRNAAIGGAVVVASSAVARMTTRPTPGVPTLLSAQTALPGGTLDPTTITKYVTNLRVLPVMPKAGTFGGSQGDVYSIAARQFAQQLLPAGLPASTVWGYGPAGGSTRFSTPAYTIESTVNRPVRVTWSNQLVDSGGNYLPHLFTVDPTLHWANPPGGTSGRDSHPTFTSTPPPYTGPVPLVTHLHGAHVVEESDGYPEAWTLPVAKNIPSGYAEVGSFYDRYKAEAAARNGVTWSAGNSIYQYSNDQRAATLWFHDHAIGMTRVNVHAGLAGFYLIRGGSADLPPGVLPGPAPMLADTPGTAYHEIPMIVQDRCFNTDGSIFFPKSRDFFGDVPQGGPFIPYTDVAPYHNPESFGNTMLVNGSTWPVLHVEPRRYRFRLLNACNARTLILKVVSDPLATRPATPVLPFWQIGSDGGFLPAPVVQSQLLTALAERVDFILDFTGMTPGTQLYLINEGPDEAFDGGTTGVDFDPADPGTSGQVMKFVVGQLASQDTSVPPAHLSLPSITDLGTPTKTWQVSLNELDSTFFPSAQAPVADMIGTIRSDGTGNPLHWSDAVTETPNVGQTQLWELTNFTADAHPVHIHQIQFQVVNRQAFGGPTRPPEPGETGFKDTVIVYPQEFARVKARFDIQGRYVYHCHILDHEDNEMMRPFQVVP